MSTNPLPLHSFLPLQAFPAPLQLPLPLQALTPAHSTPPPVLSAARATTLPASTRAAAALAMSIPLLTVCIRSPSSGGGLTLHLRLLAVEIARGFVPGRGRLRRARRHLIAVLDC